MASGAVPVDQLAMSFRVQVPVVTVPSADISVVSKVSSIMFSLVTAVSYTHLSSNVRALREDVLHILVLGHICLVKAEVLADVYKRQVMNTEKPPMVAEGTLLATQLPTTVNTSTLTIMMRPFLMSRFLFL